MLIPHYITAHSVKAADIDSVELKNNISYITVDGKNLFWKPEFSFNSFYTHPTCQFFFESSSLKSNIATLQQNENVYPESFS